MVPTDSPVGEAPDACIRERPGPHAILITVHEGGHTGIARLRPVRASSAAEIGVAEPAERAFSG